MITHKKISAVFLSTILPLIILQFPLTCVLCSRIILSEIIVSIIYEKRQPTIGPGFDLLKIDPRRPKIFNFWCDIVNKPPPECCTADGFATSDLIARSIGSGTGRLFWRFSASVFTHLVDCFRWTVRKIIY